ncbi:MAG: hypothetical protein GXP43_02010 [bacterium]|nr:hypothetical protein [bacterium]
MVLVHEIGHFLTARWFGVKIEEFGIGLPPRIMTLFKGKETLYSLNLLPIGGFVRLYGEELVDGLKAKKRAFVFKPWWVKVIVLLAGVTANFLLAGFLFGVYYFFEGISVPSDTSVTITYVMPGSAADKAGLQEKDKIELIYGDDEQVVIPKTPDDVIKFVSSRPAQKVHFKVRRVFGYNKSEVKDVVVIPVDRDGKGRIGVMVSPLEVKFYPWYKQVPLGVWYGFKDSVSWFVMIGESLGGLVKTVFREFKVPEGVTGPVGIYQVTSQIAGTGVMNLIRFVGVLSVNLAVINLLPLPALDGGRVVFVVLNGLIPSDRVKRIEYWVHLVGMAMLILLMILITFNDVLRLRK